MAKKKKRTRKDEEKRVSPTTSDASIARARRIPIGWHRAFLDAFRADFHIGNCCHQAGVARSTFYDHLKIFPQFKDKFEEIDEDWIDSADQAMYERAVNGVQSDIFQQGVKVGTKTEYSDKLLEFLMKGRRRRIYGEKVQVDATLKPGRMTEEEEATAGEQALKDIMETIREAAMRGVPKHAQVG